MGSRYEKKNEKELVLENTMFKIEFSLVKKNLNRSQRVSLVKINIEK